MYDFRVTYICDKQIRYEYIVADSTNEALQLFCNVHPKLRVITIEII